MQNFKIRTHDKKVLIVYDVLFQDNCIMFLVYRDNCWTYMDANEFEFKPLIGESNTLIEEV